MTSILDGPDTAGAAAEKPADPVVAGSCPGSEPAADGQPPQPPSVGREPPPTGAPDRGPAGPQEQSEVPVAGGSGGPHAVVRFTQALASALDGLQGAAAWSMSPAEQREALVELRRQQARLKELELRVLVAGDRNSIGADTGATSTPAWLADATKSTRAAC